MMMKRILAPPVDGLHGPAVGEEGAERRAESEEAVVEAPHGQGGGVQETVTVTGRGQGPQALAGPWGAI